MAQLMYTFAVTPCMCFDAPQLVPLLNPQVEQLLLMDPENAELRDMYDGLTEVIEMTRDLLKDAQEQHAAAGPSSTSAAAAAAAPPPAAAASTSAAAAAATAGEEQYAFTCTDQDTMDSKAVGQGVLQCSACC